MKTYLLIAALTIPLSAQAALVLDEPFAYADGPLTRVSSGSWSNHSGTALQVEVAGGKVNLSQSETEDVARGLAGAPYNGPTLYVSFVVNFSALPLSGTGTYFAHFKDDGISNFRCRVFATITGAASGMFRVGVANASATGVIVLKDLMLATDYTLVMRYNSGTGASTVWINPGFESAASDRADGTDTVTAVGITTFALRQSNAGGGMGVLALDNLKIGTAFSDVVTPALRVSASGDDVQICWSSSISDYVLQATDDLALANWLPVNDPILVQGDKVIVNYNNTTGHRFFRLVKP